MAKILAVLFVILIVTNSFAQDVKVISRDPNFPRIAKAWNTIAASVNEWNSRMEAAGSLLHERFNPKLVIANSDEKRKECVIHYKAAREELIKELDALNTLIEEEDY